MYYIIQFKILSVAFTSDVPWSLLILLINGILKYKFVKFSQKEFQNMCKVYGLTWESPFIALIYKLGLIIDVRISSHQTTFDENLLHRIPTKFLTQHMGYTEKSTYKPYINEIKSPDSSVGIVTRLWTGRQTHCASISNSSNRSFYFPDCPLCLLGVPSFLLNWYWGYSTWSRKLTGHIL